MLAFGDLYKVLQVDPEAEREVIRAAYRALALKYHPDVSSSSHDRMTGLNHA
jgi:DnaJ-class molecular chaperone